MIQQPQTIKNQFKHLDKVIIIQQPAEKKSLPHICWNAYKPYTPPQKKNTNTTHFLRCCCTGQRFCSVVSAGGWPSSTIPKRPLAVRWVPGDGVAPGSDTWDGIYTHKIYPSCGYLFHLICIYMCINKYVCVLYMEHLGFDIFETLGILESHPRKTSI